jgi:hypothetical protein
VSCCSTRALPKGSVRGRLEETNGVQACGKRQGTSTIAVPRTHSDSRAGSKESEAQGSLGSQGRVLVLTRPSAKSEARRMGVDQPIGAALPREISEEEYQRTCRAETELDAFVDRRARQEQRLRAEAEAWAESARIYHQERQRVLAIEWREFHYQQADRCRSSLISIVSYHEAEAERYDRLIPAEASLEQRGA